MKRLASNLILGLFILMLVVVYGVAKQPAVYSLTTPAVRDADRQAVLPDGSVLNVEVADSDEERIQGLSDRESLADNGGMLFVYANPGQHGIWMKDMNFAIDILWLDDAGEVVHVVEEATVPADNEDLQIYHNSVPAKYVLEVAAGTVEEAGIDVGEKVIIS